MNTITDKLAAALRDMIDTAQGGPRANRAANIEASREAIVVLAEYDALRARLKEVPVCARCGSTDVSAETSLAYWDVSEQEWKVSEICDKGHYCGACEGETRLAWRPATKEEIGV